MREDGAECVEHQPWLAVGGLVARRWQTARREVGPRACLAVQQRFLTRLRLAVAQEARDAVRRSRELVGEPIHHLCACPGSQP